MSLPRLMLIADRFTDPVVASRTMEAIRFGVRWVQLRDHDAPTDQFEESASKLTSQIYYWNPEAVISVNARLSVAGGLSLPFHTGAEGPTIYEAHALLGQTALIGRSAHFLYDAADAVRDGAKYVTFGSIHKTPSHPEREGVGINTLKQVCEKVAPIPVIAIGGITPDRVGACLNAGAHGVAVHSGILKAPNLFEAVKAYSNELPGL